MRREAWPYLCIAMQFTAGLRLFHLRRSCTPPVKVCVSVAQALQRNACTHLFGCELAHRDPFLCALLQAPACHRPCPILSVTPPRQESFTRREAQVMG